MKIGLCKHAALWLVLFAFTLVVSCKKEEQPSEPAPTVSDELILSENVIVIDTLQMGSPSIQGDNYTFDKSHNLPHFEIGDIIVGQTGYGYMRKIIDINEQGNEMTLVTSQAVLEEVIENCMIKDSIKLTLQKAVYKGREYPARMVYLAEGVSIADRGGIDLTGLTLFSGVYNGVNVTAQIDQGAIDFEPVFTRELEIRFFKLKHLKLSAGGDLDFTCDASISVDSPVSLDKEQTIAQVYFGPFPLGPVPVFIVLSFKAGFNTSLDITGSIGSGYDTRAYLEYGAEYTNSQWYPIWEKSFISNSRGIAWDLSGDISSKVYVSPEIGVLVASVAGPYMEAVPYFGFDGSVDAADQTWQWYLAAGAEGNVGFTVQVFGHTIANYSTTLASWEAIIDQDNGVFGSNTPPTAVLSVNPGYGSTATIFELDGSGSYDDEDPLSALMLRWDFDGDGTWDTGWDLQKTVDHQYSVEGTYNVKMEIKDTEGLTDDVVQSISVSASGGSGCDGITSVSYGGQDYPTVEMGDQCWMKENLNHDMGNSWCYGNDSSNCLQYGKLYDWNTALQVCPPGWHLPSDDEWMELEMFLGMSQSQVNETGWRGTDEGTQLKSGGNSGFDALLGGEYSLGMFTNLENHGYFWTSSGDAMSAYIRYLYESKPQIAREQALQSNGYSVRCLKDE